MQQRCRYFAAEKLLRYNVSLRSNLPIIFSLYDDTPSSLRLLDEDKIPNF